MLFQPTITHIKIPQKANYDIFATTSFIMPVYIHSNSVKLAQFLKLNFRPALNFTGTQL